MIVLSKEQVIALHSQLIAETGGVDGLRDEGLLDSALNAPFITPEQLDAELEKAYASMKANETVSFEDAFSGIRRKYGV